MTITSYICRGASSLIIAMVLGCGMPVHAKGDSNDLPPGTFQTKQIVQDLTRASDFYAKVFAIVPAMRFQSVMNHRPMEEVLFNFPNGGLVPLVLIKFLDDGAVSHEQTVNVFFTDDIDALIERVERNGGRVTERRDDVKHRARIAFWYDPEGNLLETVQMY